ncbi:hypothetical protein E3P99_00563 [Wallemia hederae]|uniref:Calponin-homology (CH) domain-containing protein n=1 Tax=Wallemia hederae TaxID=1540922 RepID=A0A4T0FVC7_9BASI|nr:hypothetical protein E3P99_00563 [Wallemia hederae]
MASRETTSLLAWINSYGDILGELHDGAAVTDISELADGVILSGILHKVDPDAFPSPQINKDDNSFTSRLQSLTKLQASLTSLLPNLPPLNLSLLASATPSNAAGAEHEVVQLVKHALIAAVKGAGGPSVVQGIGQLGEQVGAGLMLAITPVMSKLDNGTGEDARDESMVDNSLLVDRSSDEDYYALLATHTALTQEKKTVETAYQQLLDDMRSLRAEHDDTIAELASLREEASMHESSASRAEITGRAEESLRNELARVRDELQKSEDNLAESEAVNERHNNAIRDMQRKIDDLSTKAAEASKMRDQLEENKHAVAKLQKTENVIEKYKQKLEESANLRRQFKSLEDQNAKLVDINASLEANAKHLNAGKTLAETYKTQLMELEGKHAQRNKEHHQVSYELEQLRLSYAALEEEKTKASEHIDLLEEKVKEMEADKTHADPDQTLSNETQEKSNEDLELALNSTSTTDLKLQVRRLMNELQTLKSDKGGDPNRVVVLENVLADTQRMKERYESDWMGELTQKLDLQRKMDEIRRGMDEGANDGPEVAIALRQRLNESTDELDRIKKSFAELQSVHNGVADELTKAKSDLTLVSKDQIDILNSLRQSVDAEKSEMNKENRDLKETVRKMELHEKETLEKMNGLLIERMDGPAGALQRGMTDSDKTYMSQLMGDLQKPSNKEEELLERVHRAESQVQTLNLTIEDMKKRHLKRRQEMFLNHKKVSSAIDTLGDKTADKQSWLGLQRANVSVAILRRNWSDASTQAQRLFRTNTQMKISVPVTIVSVAAVALTLTFTLPLASALPVAQASEPSAVISQIQHHGGYLARRGDGTYYHKKDDDDSVKKHHSGKKDDDDDDVKKHGGGGKKDHDDEDVKKSRGGKYDDDEKKKYGGGGGKKDHDDDKKKYDDGKKDHDTGKKDHDDKDKKYTPQPSKQNNDSEKKEGDGDGKKHHGYDDGKKDDGKKGDGKKDDDKDTKKHHGGGGGKKDDDDDEKKHDTHNKYSYNGKKHD